MRKYELMLIVNPETTEEQREAVLTTVEKELVAAGAQELVKEVMGEKKLAYSIEKKKTGVYTLFKFNSDGKQLVNVENRLNIMEAVIRFMIVKMEG